MFADSLERCADFERDAVGETPTAAVETTALPKNALTIWA
jgi:hypothetical protein